MLEHFNRVVNKQSEILDAGPPGGNQAVPYTRLVYLNSDKVLLRIFVCLLHEGVAVAEADFQAYIRFVAKHAREIE